MEASVCLVMIVKNDSHVIERCLKSVLPYVDGVIIHDTGSTDDTFNKIWKLVDKFPRPLSMKLEHVQWQDFAHNRNMVLLDVPTAYDWILTIDADEELIGPGMLPNLGPAELYNVKIDYNGVNYTRPLIFRNNMNWAYKGVVHEYLESAKPSVTGMLPNTFTLKVHHEGSRSKDPMTYVKDATLLKDSLETLPSGSYDYARNLFYLAQSYRDAGRHREAYNHYIERSTLTTGWYQEAAYSAFQAGRMMELMKSICHEEKDILIQYLHAYAMDTTRAEPLYYAAKLPGTEYGLKHLFLTVAKELNKPVGGLFVESAVYDYLCDVELSVVFYYMNQKQRGHNMTLDLLKRKDLPDNIVNTLIRNLKFYEEKLV
jgi:glycosyltransferase involved in cell wall biosynthesis